MSAGVQARAVPLFFLPSGRSCLVYFPVMQTRRVLSQWALGAAFFTGIAAGLPSPARAQLEPPPVPPENPITEPKRLLGKLLFWEEQVSSDDTIACGGCHQPAAGGSDLRVSINPGPDGFVPSSDDIAGSSGVVRKNAFGIPKIILSSLGPQVTSRSALTVIGAAYAPELFAEGRAGTTFVDPESGGVSIVSGGALENQALRPILSPVEMAYEGRTWMDVRAKLQHAMPLRDATGLPPDLAAVVSSHASYPELFAAAFGDPAISARRIAFAIAAYERTLIPDQTPWDRFMRGDSTAMTAQQAAGFNAFQSRFCVICHSPPAFTDQNFHNIGMRPPEEDPGRQIVTGERTDAGRFKTPTLRNAGLKPTHMHNGRLVTMTDAVRWYRTGNPDRNTENLDGFLPVDVAGTTLTNMVAFLTNGLTDPRVAAESFPFDRPTLHGGKLPALQMAADRSTLSWPALSGVTRYNVYRGALAELRTLGPDGLPATGFGVCVSEADPNAADTVFVDTQVPAPGTGFFYLKDVVDSHGDERGLGATSDGRARTVLVPCPPPS